MPKTKQINSIHRAVDVLNVLSQGISRLEDIYQHIELSKSTTHRLLKSLSASGLAYQDPATRFYHLGPALLRLASNPQVSHQLLIVCAQKELMLLNKITKESVLILVPCGLQRVVVKQVSSPLDVSFTFKEGHCAPLHVGSSGKLLLSMMDDYFLEMILKNLELVRLGPNTITDKKILIKELDMIRKQGYAMSFGETQAGTAGGSAPITNYLFPAVLCLLGPQFRFEPADYLDELIKCADRISKKLLRISKQKKIRN